MEMPRARQPHERIQTYDTFGRLKYLGREAPQPGEWKPGKECRMIIECECGQIMLWAHQEVARRRRRWHAQGLTPQCKACEHKATRGPALRPLWMRNMDGDTIRKTREIWRSMCFERVRQDREFRGSMKAYARFMGGKHRFCDPLQFHIDRRWTSVFEGNPDPFETFLFDMGSQPDDRPCLLRRDPYGPLCKANCYWGTTADRRNNRTDLPENLRKLGTRVVALPDSDELGQPHDFDNLVPYSIVQGSVYDPDPATNPDFGNYAITRAVIC